MKSICQRRNLTRFAIHVSLTIAALAAVWMQVGAAELTAPKAIPDRVEKRVRQIMAGRFNDERLNGLAKLFKESNLEAIRALQNHADDSVALQAAWEEVNRTAIKTRVSKELPDREKLSWFVEFVERRGELKVPAEWKQAILNSKIRELDETSGLLRRRTLCIRIGEPNTWPYQQLGLGHAFAPGNTTMRPIGDKYEVQIENESITLPRSLFCHSSNGQLWDCISPLMTKSRCYLVLHGELGAPHHLHCIDRATDQVLWKVRVLNDYSPVLEGFVAHGSMDVVTEQEERVIVFESAYFGAYLEAVRAEDGKSRFRFATMD